MTRASRRKRRSGQLLLIAGVTLTLGVLTGLGVGAGIIGAGGGCDDVLTRYDAGQPITADELTRCQSALPNQLQIAAAGANFVPTGADDAIILQPMAAVLEQASRDAPTGDAPLPGSVQGALDDWPGQNHCTTRTGTLNPFGDTPFCYSGNDYDVGGECSSEGNSAGGGVCPGSYTAVACIRETTGGGLDIRVYDGLSASGVREARAACRGDFVNPWNP